MSFNSALCCFGHILQGSRAAYVIDTTYVCQYMQKYVSYFYWWTLGKSREWSHLVWAVATRAQKTFFKTLTSLLLFKALTKLKRSNFIQQMSVVIIFLSNPGKEKFIQIKNAFIFMEIKINVFFCYQSNVETNKYTLVGCLWYIRQHRI